MNLIHSPRMQQIINDKLTFGNFIDDLKIELSENTWSVSLNRLEKREITADELQTFIEAVISNRQTQISEQSRNHGMIFYLWHDRQAGQLRFSLISDWHEKLPFSAKIINEDLENIIREFLNSTSFSAWEDLEILEYTQENAWESDYPDYVRVYQRHLR